MDNNDETRNPLKKYLERLGYDVRCFSNPIQALEYANPETPDELLISDVVMPKMSGKELAIKIKETKPSIKIIFVFDYDGGALENNSRRKSSPNPVIWVNSYKSKMQKRVKFQSKMHFL